ncbi:MAG: lysophospholipid acyltransferase family protein [Deltaproteobacteria bacterium]|nr:lysophospholipid acyltransferase family protein [Deltaproteobacteria bacterium]
MSDQSENNLPNDVVFERTLRLFAGPLVYYALGLDKIHKIYSAAIKNVGEDFVSSILSEMNVEIEVPEESLANIPKTGPTIVVSNHPFGGIEGLVMVEILARIRNDVRLLANYLLNTMPEARKYFLGVDPFGGSKATRSNISSMREMLKHLKAGGLLALFPSGTVSHLHLLKCEVMDPEWNDNLCTMVRKSGASVVPLYFHGRNSCFFQLMGLIHPRLRTALLAREFGNKQNKTISVDIGSSISNDKLMKFETDAEMLSFIRLRTYILRHRAAPQQDKQIDQPANYEIICSALPAELLDKEIHALPAEQKLSENSETEVFYASAEQIPNTLHEIGRLREVTFRAANEGTGKSIDLDKFDSYYTHLFAWNKEKKEIIGAYRIGKCDLILNQYGITGLYTHSLFRYSSSLIEQITPALELGRSFIQPEYQKNFFSLLLLWKGIGHYVVKNPAYKNLFGPVSISSEYDTISRQLIVSFLRSNNFLPQLAKLIKPRKPHRNIRIRGVDKRSFATVVKDINDVSQLITEIEAKESSVPVLLKQYLKLGGKLLGFNIDPEFGNVLDGLILVDLTETNTKMLAKYLGEEGVQKFLEYQNKISPTT